jgi:lipopolysaccharide export LptBFGC system permease protein LptF
MIEPAVTFWPEKSFTPLYWALLSLPFLEEPCPFLCAIISHLCPFNVRPKSPAFYIVILTTLFDLVQRFFKDFGENWSFFRQ